jgi:nitrogen fixation protein NifQ
LPGADGTGEVGLESSQAGSRLAVRFALKVELDRVTDARYQVFGCGFSMAACAVAADMTVGYRLSDVMNIDAERLEVALDGLPAEGDTAQTWPPRLCMPRCKASSALKA